jgi:hypothetical protein
VSGFPPKRLQLRPPTAYHQLVHQVEHYLAACAATCLVQALIPNSLDLFAYALGLLNTGLRQSGTALFDVWDFTLWREIPYILASVFHSLSMCLQEEPSENPNGVNEFGINRIV